ncbi:MAG: hypothetical protein ACRC50_11580, partial [Gaiella sp.]
MTKKPSARKPGRTTATPPPRSRSAAAAGGTYRSHHPRRIPDRVVLTSVTRIADLGGASISLLPRRDWATGDYVVGEVPETIDTPFDVELTTGRMADVVAGDAVVGAFGRRAATLEAVGDWTAIGSDLRMHALTRAGVLGRATSATPAAR